MWGVAWASILADQIPSNVVIVPVEHGRCIALHPTKPILYVGRARSSDGRHLVTVELNSDGSLSEASHREHMDGAVAKTPLDDATAYEINRIAINPALPQIAFSVRPRNPKLYHSNPDHSTLVALSLDENGMPDGKIGSLGPLRNKLHLDWIAFDPSGRLLYFNEHLGYAYGLNIEEKGELSDRVFMLQPPTKLRLFLYMREWKCWYGIDSGLRRVMFTLSSDGKRFNILQYISIGQVSLDGLAVSVTHRKLYAPNYAAGRFVVQPLGPDGGFTSVQRAWTTSGARHVCVDESNNVLFDSTFRGTLFIYNLDEDGFPSAEPQRYELNSGDVYDMVRCPQTGTIYLAVDRPAKE